MAKNPDFRDPRFLIGALVILFVGWYVWNWLPGSQRTAGLWETDPRLLAGSADPRRPLTLVEFATPQCIACRRMAGNVFTKQAVVDAMKSFVCLQLNAYENQAAAKRFQVRGVPLFIVLDPTGRTLKTRAGYMSPDKFMRFLKEARDAHASPSNS